MDRQAWLTQRRAAVIAVYDAEAATYDDNLYPADMQQEWVTRVLRLIPSGGAVLDAPCGTGRYFSLIAGAGMRVTGVDQSSGMLAKARARNLAVSLMQRSLLDLSYSGEFDAAVTIDAMENVPPEDWPTVLARLRDAVRPGGVLYFTVERRPGVRGAERARPAGGARRSDRRRRGRLSLLPGPRTSAGLARGCPAGRDRRGSQRYRRLGLQTLSAAQARVTAASTIRKR
jgi:SAM-dependent methyltransferase